MKLELKQGKQPSRRTVFHELLSHTDELPPEEFTKPRLRDEAQTIIGAGLTTTAWSITNACFYLIESPEKQAKLREELFKAIPNHKLEGAFDNRKLEALPYLRGCVKEGIRLSLGVSGRNNRVWEKDLPYKDWIIPAGTTVTMNQQDILLNEDIFPDPTEIVPERWFNNPRAPDGSSLERYFVPFGKGERQCLGMLYVISHQSRS